MKRRCWACAASSAISRTILNGRSFLNLDGFAPAEDWEELLPVCDERPGGPMTYSYTQISQYLRCPRSYRYRYLDGWREKDTRASLLFGRALRRPCGLLSRRTALPRCSRNGEHTGSAARIFARRHWERMFRQGVQLLERLAQDDRIRIRQPHAQHAGQAGSFASERKRFVAYVDAMGRSTASRCLLEWKTTTARYPEEPEGLLALDPQLICYSWISGISDVAVVAFVRKRIPEIQYLKTTITDQQRQSSAELVEATVSQIEAGQFLPHSGIRFPQNGCVSCAQLGLCLGNQQLVEAKLIRRPGASDLDWLDQLDD